ncbi:MAG: peptidoglycan DD-metalloendopeptidase family protein [Rhizobiaceae bacterium]
MTHAIDPRFRMRKEAAIAQRRRVRVTRFAMGLATVLLAAGAFAVWWTVGQTSVDADMDEELAMTDEAAAVPPDAAVYVPAIVDLAGDPMWLTLAREGGATTQLKSISRPADLASFNVAAQIHVLSDAMVSSSERFMTTIPSSQEDFAFFQAQKDATLGVESQDLDVDLQPAVVDVEPDDLSATDLQATGEDVAAGWGETVDQGEAALPAFEKTAIENNTSVASVTPEDERLASTEDVFIKVLNNRTLDSVVIEANFSAQDATLAGEALKALFSRETLEAGNVVAMRGFRPRRDTLAPMLMQVSVYSSSTYIGTMARDAAGRFVVGVDPWVRDDLFNYSGRTDDSTGKRQYRLLDAIYSTAARNNVPTGVIGEAIMYLSRGQDLNSFVDYGDRFILVYSEAARGKDGVSGKVLYAGVHRAEADIECFVFQQSDGEFACVTKDDQVRSVTVSNGMVTPVNGVMTSTFGPRRHPILKTVRIHKGVDWAAPTGTPIMAAFDGTIAFQGDGAGYGNLVKIAHPDGRETRYAHMSKFAPNTPVGTAVKAGEVIGYVGTTGLSTGPHLHFEVYLAGQAIDPLGAATTIVAATDGDNDDAAVETLVDRIIRVESGGNARAKNPLSSAEGLGQFIDSTWIRMMNTYRPDLVASLSRAQLLELKFDPTLSREMVRNLAREGEAYLKARGHHITAGRLYLCHFLGMQGASVALSASAEATVLEVMGAGVVNANPFLRGRNIAYLQSWAEKKMGRRTSTGGVSAPSVNQPAVVTREIKQTSPEFERYKAAMSDVVRTTEPAT